MKYYRRFRPAGDPFYIDEKGNIVSESVAKTNLVEESAFRPVIEADGRIYVPALRQKQNGVDSRLVEGFKALGLTEAEALIAAGQEPAKQGDPFLNALETLS
jgi:hypothetical protein